jgi:hypothetical protein
MVEIGLSSTCPVGKRSLSFGVPCVPTRDITSAGCSIVVVRKAGGLVARVQFSAPRQNNGIFFQSWPTAISSKLICARRSDKMSASINFDSSLRPILKDRMDQVVGENEFGHSFSILIRAHSKVALRGIRIAEAGVRFSLGPQKQEA